MPSSLDMNKPVYVAAGMPRSGSTWLYNALRLLLQNQALYSCWVDEFDHEKASRADILLIKIHRADPELASQARAIFTCHRDLRDVAVSIKDMGWIGSNDEWLDRIETAVKEHDFWSSQSEIDLAYEDIKQKPFQTLYKLSCVLHPAQNKLSRFFLVVRICFELNNLPEAKSQQILHHPETLLHYHHRKAGGVSRWRTQLPSDVVIKIEIQHKDWLARMGYLRELTTSNDFKNVGGHAY